jgi:hypothetical protein
VNARCVRNLLVDRRLRRTADAALLELKLQNRQLTLHCHHLFLCHWDLFARKEGD